MPRVLHAACPKRSGSAQRVVAAACLGLLAAGCAVDVAEAPAPLAEDKALLLQPVQSLVLAPSPLRLTCAEQLRRTPRPQSRKVDADALIDGDAFVEAFRASLDGDDMGHVAVLQNNRGRNVATDRYGWAMSPCEKDGGEAWTVDTVSSIGSVSKVITAAAVMHAKEQGLISHLDTWIYPALPSRWKGPWRMYWDVSWSRILGYRAGFKRDRYDGDRFPYYLDLADRDDEKYGIDHRLRTPPENDIDDWVYNNWHGMAGLLLYPLVEPEAAARFERNARTYGWSDDEYEDVFNWFAGNTYVRYTKEHVLDPAGARLASCDLEDAERAGRPYAKVYSSPLDTSGETVHPELTSAPLVCPAGGWMMTARGLARFTRTLRHSNKIISREGYREITRLIVVPNKDHEVPNMAFDGFDDLSVPEGPGSLDGFGDPGPGSPAYAGGSALEKGGDLEGYGALMAMLPHGYTLVALSNTAGSGRLKAAARDAWNAAYKGD